MLVGLQDIISSSIQEGEQRCFFFFLSDSRNENGPSILGSTRVIKNMAQSQVKEIMA